jgi:type VI secretion system protein ImpM
MNAAAAGWYGKLASLGDFASRRLPEAVVRQLDGWLATVVEGSRQQLGEAWLDAYLATPVQRFVLGPGVLDAGWWFGVLMPSCDNVGRYFPLVVAQPRAAPATERFGLDHLDLWWQRAAEAALQTLTDGADVQRFESALEALPPWPVAREPAPWWPAGAAAKAAVVVPAGTAASDFAQAVAAAEGAASLRGRSLWWSWQPQGGPTVLRVAEALPSAAEFAAMLGAGS